MVVSDHGYPGGKRLYPEFHHLLDLETDEDLLESLLQLPFHGLEDQQGLYLVIVVLMPHDRHGIWFPPVRRAAEPQDVVQVGRMGDVMDGAVDRSEEHTSELQSQPN